MKIRPMLLLLPVLVLAVPGFANDPFQAELKEKPISILFIGNSYTAQSMKKIRDMFKFREQVVDVMAITPGGAKLEDHIKNREQIERFLKRKYDFVVLQEQSQVPALSDKIQKRFEKSAVVLNKWIKDSGAITILFMTWGRRDGDKSNYKLNPNFDIMQHRLTTAYRNVADKYKIRLAPVGDVFAQIKKEYPTLFPKLYARDGSHPGPLGATAAAFVIYATVSGQMPPLLDTRDPERAREEKALWHVVKNVMEQEKYRKQTKLRGGFRSFFKR
ncbi:MAG: hypothetical protein AAF492_04410 [Verrucomicrobiota bacterium]